MARATHSATSHDLPDGSGQAFECIDAATISSFEKRIAVGTPFIARGAAACWPAIHRWRDLDYLKSAFGHIVIPVEAGSHYMAEGHRIMDMPFGMLLQYMHEKEANPNSSSLAASIPTLYLAQHHIFSTIPGMARDCMRLPTGFEHLERHGLRINGWIGPAGTISPTHRDPYQNILCQVVGSKYIRLYDAATDAKRMYPSSDKLQKNTSSVDDVRNPNKDRFPLFASLPFYEGSISAGDVLYLPMGWWHYIESKSTSISINFWWDPPRGTGGRIGGGGRGHR